MFRLITSLYGVVVGLMQAQLAWRQLPSEGAKLAVPKLYNFLKFCLG
jgi:hypothetical protein